MQVEVEGVYFWVKGVKVEVEGAEVEGAEVEV